MYVGLEIERLRTKGFRLEQLGDNDTEEMREKLLSGSGRQTLYIKVYFGEV